MILLKNVNVPLDTDFNNLFAVAAKALKIFPKDIKTVELYRKSVDARHKNNIVFCCSFLVTLGISENTVIKKNKNAEIYNENPYVWKKCSSRERPVIVGFGPAGMFAALVLSRAGLKPIIIERGRDVDTRLADIENFWAGGKLDTESNVQFGEGGAGTFSDGKLNTGIKDNRCREVLKMFHKYGADKKILYEAKPHIGTDVLRNVVKNIRKDIIAHGGEVYFSTRMDEILCDNGKISGIKVTENGKERIINTRYVVLATGHSARDTFEMLRNKGITMERKPFSVGARIEHLQRNINRSLYGDLADHPALGAADYKMAVHLGDGRGVYTFCMCPGGVVVNASSEEGMTAVNGMSYSSRDGDNANSALLVEVKPEDLAGDDILAGVEFQREIERKAYTAAKGGVPCCRVGDLIKTDICGDTVEPTVKPDTAESDIYKVLPEFAVDSIKAALPLFEGKIKGFSDANALLTFPETRSSSPVRILRNEAYASVCLSGLYPAGEGAGYAGGIMSAAVDGMRVAEAVINQLNIG